MSRTRLDAVVAALVAAIVLLGAGAAWQTYRQAQAHGQMMDHGAAFHGPHPAWYLFGGLVLAAVVGGAYLLVRDGLQTASKGTGDATDEPSSAAAQVPNEPAEGLAGAGAGSERVPAGEDRGPMARPHVLEVLPEDERRVLEPVVEEPGITQIALRDRSEFSKSKVSQTVTDLEKRGLLYRERQGRTYRVYPSDDLPER